MSCWSDKSGASGMGSWAEGRRGDSLTSAENADFDKALMLGF